MFPGVWLDACKGVAKMMQTFGLIIIKTSGTLLGDQMERIEIKVVRVESVVDRSGIFLGH